MKLLCLVLWLAPALAAAQPSEPPLPPPEPRACVPACRDGFSCIDGTCVSACNPPCAFNEVCTGNAPAICRRNDPPPPVAPPPPPPPAATTTTIITAPPPPFAPPAQPSIDNAGSFHVNLIGVLQLGPTVALEFGGRTTFAGRFRAMNAGALSYVIVADESSGETLGFSFGVAGTLRHYYGRHGWDPLESTCRHASLSIL